MESYGAHSKSHETSPETDIDERGNFFDEISWEQQADGVNVSSARLEATDVYVAPETSLADLIQYRADLDEMVEEGGDREEIVARAVDKILPELDDQDPKHRARNNARGQLRKAFLANEKSFSKISRQYETNAASDLGIKLAKPEKPAKPIKEKGPSIRERLNEKAAERWQLRAETGMVTTAERKETPRGLGREVRKLDKSFDGSVGRFAKADITEGMLSDMATDYREAVAEAGHNVNDRTRSSIQKESARKAMRAHGLDDLKDREGIGDDVDTFEAQLIADLIKYDNLDETDQTQLRELLAKRQEIAIRRDELSSAEAENSKEKAHRGDRTKRSLGKISLSGAGLKKKFADFKRSRHAKKNADDDQYALFDEAPYRKSGARHRKTSPNRFKNSANSLVMLPTRGYHDLMARHAIRKQRQEERRAAMTPEERERYDNKRSNTKAAIGVVAVVAVAALAAKYGWDHRPSGPNTKLEANGDAWRHWMDSVNDTVDDLKGSITPDHQQGIEPGTTISPDLSGGGLSRNELFNGMGGNRSLSSANIDHLREFMGDYKVKASDDRGVWGIAEKYLQSQGVKNPTVFETDAVKDFILQHSSLTDSSIIYPGDTIKLK